MVPGLAPLCPGFLRFGCGASRSEGQAPGHSRKASPTVKPCQSCGNPLETRLDTCPRCGAAQREGVEIQDRSVNPDFPDRTPPHERSIRQDFLAALSLIGRSVLVGATFAGVGAGIGYAIHGVPGLIVGGVLGFLVKIVLLGLF